MHICWVWQGTLQQGLLPAMLLTVQNTLDGRSFTFPRYVSSGVLNVLLYVGTVKVALLSALQSTVLWMMV